MTQGQAYKDSIIFCGLTPKIGFKAGSLYLYKPIGGALTWDRNTTANRVNQLGELELMGINVPRVDYSNTCPELLIEKESTNLLTYSNDFSNADWNKDFSGTGVAPVISANFTTGPNGLPASKIKFNCGGGIGTSDFSFVSQNPGVFVGDLLTGSIYIAGALGGEQILFRSMSGVYELKTLTTNWERIELSNVYSINEFAFGLRQGLVGTINSEIIVYVAASQLEAGEYATSYIPTTASIETRVADVVSENFSNSTDTMSCMIRVRLDSTCQIIKSHIYFHEITEGSYIALYNNGDNTITLQFLEAISGDTFDTTSSVLEDGIHTVGFTAENSGGQIVYQFSIDGATVDTGTTTGGLSMPLISSFTKIAVGITNQDTFEANTDKIIGFQYFENPLTLADLNTLTA